MMLTDDDLDSRLRAAGERFRARTSEPASVTPPRHTRRRSIPLLAAAASAAVVVGLVVAITQLTGRSAPHGGAAPGHAMPITGVHWQLASAVDAKGDPVAVTGNVELFLDNATLTANDGCNSIGGPVQLRGDELRFGNLISTTIGCPDWGEQEHLVDAVLRGTVSYAIEGGTLTLTKTGTGSLTYHVAKPAPATTPDPSALPGPAWRLTGVERVSGQAVSSETVSDRYVLTFDGKGQATLVERCGTFYLQVSVAGAHIRFSNPRFVLSPPCGSPGQAEPDVEGDLANAATWTLDDNGTRLTLSTGDIRLVFRG